MAGLLQLSPEAPAAASAHDGLVGGHRRRPDLLGASPALLEGPPWRSSWLLPPWQNRPESISGGMIFGGLLLFLFGLFKIMRFVSGLFTDRVIGVILMLISW
jgi:hypothetical protein